MSLELPVIECVFDTEASLYTAYMPFIKGGGLFVRTRQAFPLGSEVILSVKLPGEAEHESVEARVVWLTPKGAQGNKPAGVGVQLTDKAASNLLRKIETCLADVLKSTKPTDTM